MGRAQNFRGDGVPATKPMFNRVALARATRITPDSASVYI